MDWYSKHLMKKAVVSPETALSLKIERQLPTDETFIRSVQNTKGARITEDGLELEVTRNQHPDQAGNPSTRSGIFYQPSGSNNKYPYSGKQGYGGEERIEGKTLLQRPLFVKGATGGKAPQMAYDRLKGKGSYEKMREEVLKIVFKGATWLRVSDQEMRESIQSLLEKYGGDIDLVGEINELRHSAKSNNFAYAMQENIVAATVRNAGYDSIIGWSIKKDGNPFFSEVFDLRETTYPSQFSPEGEIHRYFFERIK